MIPTTKEYKNAILKNRELHYKAKITLEDGTILNITDENIMSGGFSIEDAVSNDNTFDIGAAITNKLSLKLDNTDEKYSVYDFFGAEVIPEVGLVIGNGIDWLKKGIFEVDTAQITGSCVALTCLDNMRKFDKPYSLSTLAYPTTLKYIIADICDICGVELANDDFSNAYYIAAERPVDEALTCRVVLSYVGQICGFYARCNTDGELEFKWYDNVFADIDHRAGGKFDAYNNDRYETGAALYGGTFEDYTSGDSVNDDSFDNMARYHHIYQLSSQDISLNDVEVTGMRVTTKDEDSVNCFRFDKMRCEKIAEDYLTIEQLGANSVTFVRNALEQSNPLERQCYASFENIKGESTLVSAGDNVTLTWDYVMEKGETNSENLIMMEILSREYSASAGFIDKPFSVPISYKKTSFNLAGDKDGNAIFGIGVWFNPEVLDTKITIGNISVYNNTKQTPIAKEGFEGESGYVLTIKNNPLISPGNAQNVASYLYKKAGRMKFRPMKISALSDPSIEAGDPAFVSDRKGNSYNTFLTNVTFTAGGYQSLSCGAETIGENSSTQYSDATKITADTTIETARQIQAYDLNLQTQLNAMLYLFGLHKTIKNLGGETHFYIHDKSNMEQSQKIWQIYRTKDGERFLVSSNGGATWIEGFDNNGNPVQPLIGGN